MTVLRAPRGLALLALLVSTLAFGAPSVDSFFRDIEVDDAGGLSDLLKKGFDPNTRDAKGQVALYVALRDGSPKAAKLLWQAPGLEVDAPSPAGETPLMMAALRGDLDAVTALVDRGAAINREGWTPLHYAATGGKVPVIALLLAHGAVVDARSPNGTTPLMMAARYGSEDAVIALLKAGADRNLRNDLGMNAAGFANDSGRDFLVKRLQPEQGAPNP